MNHNLDAGPFAPYFTRETGIEVQRHVADGLEYRLHLRPYGAAYELRSWRLTARGEWVCAAVPWMSALDWIACGRALEVLPADAR